MKMIFIGYLILILGNLFSFIKMYTSYLIKQYLLFMMSFVNIFLEDHWTVIFCNFITQI